MHLYANSGNGGGEEKHFALTSAYEKDLRALTNRPTHSILSQHRIQWREIPSKRVQHAASGVSRRESARVRRRTGHDKNITTPSSLSVREGNEPLPPFGSRARYTHTHTRPLLSALSVLPPTTSGVGAVQCGSDGPAREEVRQPPQAAAVRSAPGGGEGAGKGSRAALGETRRASRRLFSPPSHLSLPLPQSNSVFGLSPPVVPSRGRLP